MPSAPHVRAATLEDAPQMALLMTSLGYPTADHEMRARLRVIAAHQDYVTLLAAEGENVVGIIGLAFGLFYERTGVYARIVALSVATHVQRQGIGKSLVIAAEQIAKQRGALTCIVNSGLHRHGAHAFYAGLNYAHRSQAFYKELAPD